MTIYFTSDLHVHHKKIMTYCPKSRALANGDVKVMNQLLIDGINSRVTAEDTLYILGDVSFTTSERNMREFLMAINAKELHLVLGNHDHIIRDSKALQKYFTSVHDYREIKIDNDRLILMHYPIESWNHMHHGAYHLHGHCHSRNDHLNEDTHRGELKYFNRRFDVGIDSRDDFKPWSWKEIKEFIDNREKEVQYADVLNQGI